MSRVYRKFIIMHSKLIRTIKQIDLTNPIQAFMVAATLAVPLAAYYVGYNSEPVSITDSSVMITRLDGRSGGSGVILESSDSSSKVVTNRHVCEILNNGGVVTTYKGESAPVVAFRKSETHDLCLITVSKNLHAHSKLAGSDPKILDRAKAVGHPNLLPIMVTEGVFSDHMLIQVMTGIKKCTKQEAENPALGLFCLLLGGIPELKTYESVVVSTLIMAGSSGSGVFNSHDELSGLVFAGKGPEISFAYVVPYHSLQYFLNEEVRRLSDTKPDYTTKFDVQAESEEHSAEEKLKKFCSDPTNKKTQICNSAKYLLK